MQVAQETVHFISRMSRLFNLSFEMSVCTMEIISTTMESRAELEDAHLYHCVIGCINTVMTVYTVSESSFTSVTLILNFYSQGEG